MLLITCYKKITMSNAWIRRRWFDFRQGHSIYLIFAMSFANFVLIFYRLLVEEVEILSQIFSTLWIFVVVFLLTYIPVAILIGLWHRRTQMKVEGEQILRHNPFFARIFRVLIDMVDGKASKEEIEDIRNLLRSIEKNQGFFSKQEEK